MKARNTDFAVAFQGLRIQARAHGLDPNTEAMRRFLVHTAEVMAQEHALLREAERYTHLHTRKPHPSGEKKVVDSGHRPGLMMK